MTQLNAIKHTNTMAEQTTTQLKTYDPMQRKLIGKSGKEYFIEDQLSGVRYMEFQAAQQELATGLSVNELMTELKSIYDLTNSTKTVRKKDGSIETISHTGDIASRLHNIMYGLKNMKERKPVVFKICSLFINSANEDRGTYVESVMQEKLADLMPAYDYQFFFRLAEASLTDLLTNYELLTHIGLKIPPMGEE